MCIISKCQNIMLPLAKAARIVVTDYGDKPFVSMSEVAAYGPSSQDRVLDERLAGIGVDVDITEAKEGIRVTNKLDRRIEFRFLRLA